MPKRHKLALIVATSVPIAAIVFAFSLGPSPEKAMRDFYLFQGAEDTLADPLIAAGDDVVPLVLAHVAKKDMPRRRYAIQFLGTGAHVAALPVLETIVADESEEDYFRADALAAILEIDRVRGLQLANVHAARTDLLGYSAKAFAGGEKPPERRGYVEALTHHHD